MANFWHPSISSVKLRCLSPFSAPQAWEKQLHTSLLSHQQSSCSLWHTGQAALRALLMGQDLCHSLRHQKISFGTNCSNVRNVSNSLLGWDYLLSKGSICQCHSYLTTNPTITTSAVAEGGFTLQHWVIWAKRRSKYLDMNISWDDMPSFARLCLSASLSH